MLEQIIRNDVNSSYKDEMLLSFLKSFTSIKCLYCHESDESNLCLCKDCGFYFCNNLLRKKSHIYIHLKGCKHENISLHPFDSNINCEICKKKNIFNLKFAKYNGKIKYLCENCALDAKNYTNIVANKKINCEIIPKPELPPLANREDIYTESLIIELNRKINLLVNIKNLPVVKMNYINKERYCNVYTKLIYNEIQTIKEEDQEKPSFPYNLKFGIDQYDYCAEIKINHSSKEKMQFYKRQILMIIKKDEFEEEEIICTGKVYGKDKNSVFIFCQGLKKKYSDGLYFIKEKETTGSFQNMLTGLEEFEQKKSNKMDINIEKIIIGNYTDELSNKNEYIRFSDIPKNLDIPEFINKNIYLNKGQKNAILGSLNHKLSIIKGPPGTGKTTVLA